MTVFSIRAHPQGVLDQMLLIIQVRKGLNKGFLKVKLLIPPGFVSYAVISVTVKL